MLNIGSVRSPVRSKTKVESEEEEEDGMESRATSSSKSGGRDAGKKAEKSRYFGKGAKKVSWCCSCFQSPCVMSSDRMIELLGGRHGC